MSLTPDSLLPAGLMDGLPPAAAHEAGVVSSLVADFAAIGYERVKPPLIEFEDGLLRDASASLNRQTFRLMDPVSQRMLAVRTDMTGQIARIAESRLAHRARPLRLAYAGDVLQVRGTQLRPERQFVQAGVELIGADSAAADIEVIILAVEALTRAGVAKLTVDLSVPMVASAIVNRACLEEESAALTRGALDQKDHAAVVAHAGGAADALVALLDAGGPAETALPALRAMALPGDDIGRLGAVVDGVRRRLPDILLTIDAVENRGFEYHCGVAFTLFAPRVRGELGRGGRYRAGRHQEPATGFSLYMDSVMRAVAPAAPPRRLWLSVDVPADRAAALRAEGWVTVAALEPSPTPQSAARALQCGHMLLGDEPAPTPLGDS